MALRPNGKGSNPPLRKSPGASHARPSRNISETASPNGTPAKHIKTSPNSGVKVPPYQGPKRPYSTQGPDQKTSSY